MAEIANAADAHPGNQGNQGMHQVQIQFVLTPELATSKFLAQSSQAEAKPFDMATPSLEGQFEKQAKSNNRFIEELSIKSKTSDWNNFKQIPSNVTKPKSE
jgi:hypothetical protein